MAVDPLGVAQHDNQGEAIRFGHTPNRVADYIKMIQQTQINANKKPTYDDDISAAQLGKIWSQDKPYFENRYRTYLDKIKAYENAPPTEREKQWKDLQMEKAALVMDINKSEDHQRQFLGAYNALQKDNKFLFSDEDHKAVDDFVATPFEKRGMLNISPASVVNADEEIMKQLPQFKLNEETIEVQNSDGSKSLTTKKWADEDRLREWVADKIDTLKPNMQNALRNHADLNSPGFATLSAQQQKDYLIQTRLVQAEHALGPGVSIKKIKAAPADKPSGKTSGIAYTGEKVAATNTQMTNDVNEINLVPSGKTIKDMPPITLEVIQKDGSVTTLKAPPMTIKKNRSGEGYDKLIVSKPVEGDPFGLKKVSTKEGEQYEVDITPYNEAQLRGNLNFDYRKFYDETKDAAEENYRKRSGHSESKPKTIKKSDIPARAKAAGYSITEYTKLLQQKGVKIE